MKSFKQYLNEFANKTGEKEWRLAIDGMLPLSPSILKDFEKDFKGVYHITSFDGLQRLTKLQGKRVDISTFTRGSDLSAEGLLEKAEVLVILDGKSSIQFEGDVHTRVDRNGIRWLSSTGSGIKKIKDIVFGTTRRIQESLVNWFDIPDKGADGRTIFNPQIKLSNWLHDKDGKTKREFIRIFMLRAKRALLDNNGALIKKIKDAVPKEDTNKLFSRNHNEILLHNFKIKGSKIILPKYADKADTDNILKKAKKTGMRKFETIKQADIRNLK